MIRNRLFRQYYVFTAIIVVVFVFLGSYASRLALRLSAPTMEGRHSIYYAKLIDQLDSKDRGKGLERLAALGGMAGTTRFAVVDGAGKVLYPPGEVLDLDWSAIPKPEREFEHLALATPFQSLIRFPGEPGQYLYVNQAHGRPRSSTVTMTTFASLGFSALIGVALAMLVLFKSLRDQAALADSVIAELQRGNLKARFPIRRRDEIGNAMGRFNRMADEIERLVEQLRSVEQSRMTLLQELAHDLRTPVASLKNLLETLQSSSHRTQGIEPALRDELMGLALKETDYFERLVEDLLVLAQVGEPRYLPSKERVNLGELLEEETEGLLSRQAPEIQKLKLLKNLSAEALLVQGDPHLLRRMIRNALDNAFSFARGEVSVGLGRDGAGSGVITISDDGVGFSESALVSFGERRVSRVLGTIHGKERLSVGLGSVIIKTVARSHGGEILASNRSSSTGQITGASLSIRLPLAITP